MRRTIVIILLAVSCFLVSCHSHTFAESWTSDDSTHWHAATCKHDLKKDEATHTVDKGVCTVCGRNVVSGKWVVDIDEALVMYEEYLRENFDTLVYGEKYADEEKESMIVQAMDDVKKNLATVSFTLYDDGESLFSFMDEQEDGTYRITHQGALYMTVDGDEEKVGEFSSDCKEFTFIIQDVSLTMRKEI